MYAGIVGDMRTSMLDEVDFRKEADHLQAFSNFLDSSGQRNVATCPFIYKQFSSKRQVVGGRVLLVSCRQCCIPSI